MPEKQRENYFILLEIDPKAPWSDEKFEKTLIQKRADWSAKSKLPGRKGAQYQEYLALVSEIQKIMRDPGQRAKEAEMAKTSQQETPGKVEQEKLIEKIDLISSKGFIEEREIQWLVREYQKFVPESFIRTEINRRNIQINQITQDVDESNLENLETLKETQLKRIKGHLETLGYKNIYDFLELSKTTAKNKLFDKAQEKYEKSQSGRKDTITDAQRGLGIESKNIFATEKTRRLYDNSLEVEQYEIIKEKIQSIAQSSSDKILYAEQFAEILKKAQSSGIENVEKAKKVIIKYAKEKNLLLEVPDIEIFKQKISCPQCNTINDRSQQKCSNCGCSLRIQCPSCNLVSAITDKACSQCSFPIGNEPNVRNYLKEARKLIDDKQYEEGLTYLNFARQEWSTIPPRPLNDDLSRAIANYSREIEHIKQKQITLHKQLQKQLQNAIDDSCYYEARSLVKQIQIEVSGINTEKEEKLIEAKIQETETELWKARNLERQGKNPIDAYKKVLWICKDFKQAKDALDKIYFNKTRRKILTLGGLAGSGFALAVLTRDLWEQLFSKIISTSQPILILGGLAGSGLVVAVLTRDLWGQLFSKIISTSEPQFTIQTFATVRVNSRGDIIRRSEGKAEVMTENIGNGVSLEMVKIPGGRFLMGSPETEAKRDDDEGPQHYVNVPEFFMGKYPVTQAQWQAVMGNNPSYFKGKNRPVEKVSWNEATKFCQKLSKKTGRDYRLPSEAEWEYACRAGTKTPFYFGETINTDLANYRGTDFEAYGWSGSYGRGPKGEYRKQTTDVGDFPPNSFGLYDMHGNVCEWCADESHDNYDGAPTDGSVWLDGDKDRSPLRGGSWDSDPDICRSAYRVNFDRRDVPYYITGFRVVCDGGRTL
jgi:formylglycine-generating enzyme required for sulfatase activity